MLSCLDFLFRNEIKKDHEEALYNFLQPNQIYINSQNSEYLAYIFVLQCYYSENEFEIAWLEQVKKLLESVIQKNSKKIYWDALAGIKYLIAGRPIEDKIIVKSMVGKYSNYCSTDISECLKNDIKSIKNLLKDS